ncbi:MAG: AI-2E family transporter [Pyrinomonadaceae bacterium]
MDKSNQQNVNATQSEQPDHSNPVVVNFTPSTLGIIKIVFIAVLGIVIGALVVYGIYLASFVLFLVLISIYIAYLLDPLVSFIRKPFKARQIEKFMPRSLAILISYVIVFGAFSIGLSLLAPAVTRQANRLRENFPGYSQMFRDSAARLNQRYERLMLSKEMEDRINTNTSKFVEEATQAIAGTVVYLMYVPWFLLVPIFAFYFLKDANQLRFSFLDNLPSGRWRARTEAILNDINKTIAAYTRAQLISCFIVGGICTIGFSIIGLDYPVLLGVLAGLFEFIPLLGPLAIGIIASLIGIFSDEPWNGLWAAAFLIVLRIVHDNFTYPRIVRGGIDLHPLAIIISIIVGEQIAGIPGVFLAIPVVAILTVTYKHFTEIYRGIGSSHA